LLPRRHFLGRALALLAGAALPWSVRRSEADVQSISPYIGDIMLIAFNFPPKNWALCNGQFLSIAQNQALFSILGTTYGGNGQTTFALPDLRDRVAIHMGQGPGLSNYAIGERSGEQAHTLSLAELPAHTHVARGSSAAGTSVSPAGMFAARNAAQIPQYGVNVDAIMGAGAISTVGGSQPHSNMQPYLGLNFVIALVGYFPPHL
jgi:microcystin-dependent protein